MAVEGDAVVAHELEGVADEGGSDKRAAGMKTVCQRALQRGLPGAPRADRIRVARDLVVDVRVPRAGLLVNAKDCAPKPLVIYLPLCVGLSNRQENLAWNQRFPTGAAEEMLHA